MRVVLAAIGILAIIGAIVIGTYFFGGFYNVGATAAEPDIVDRSLSRVRQASIARNATIRPPTPIENIANIRAGARAYAQRGCANCHGAPGVAWAKWSEGLRPDPPDLKKIVANREPREIFWVIKNGIKMTGMPSFGLIEVPDAEIWTMVAFLKKLEAVTPEEFREWSAQ